MRPHSAQEADRARSIPASTSDLAAGSWQWTTARRWWFWRWCACASCCGRTASGSWATGSGRSIWCWGALCWPCRTARPGRSTADSIPIAVESSLQTKNGTRKWLQRNRRNRMQRQPIQFKYEHPNRAARPPTKFQRVLLNRTLSMCIGHRTRIETGIPQTVGQSCIIYVS